MIQRFILHLPIDFNDAIIQLNLNFVLSDLMHCHLVPALRMLNSNRFYIYPNLCCSWILTAFSSPGNRMYLILCEYPFSEVKHYKSYIWKLRLLECKITNCNKNVKILLRSPSTKWVNLRRLSIVDTQLLSKT